MKRAVTAVIAAVVFTGCVQVEEEVTMVPGETTIYTAESDYASGKLGGITTTHFVLRSEISSDAAVVTQGNDVYILERAESNIRKVSETGSSKYQTHIIDGFNPHDLVILNDTKGYICSNNKDSIAVFSPDNGSITKYISLASYAKAPVTTNATKMQLIGSNLYVACQMRNGYAPAEGSLILKIDTNSDKVVDTIRCTYKNVLDMDLVNDQLVITSMGSYGAVDGGVEIINTVSKSVKTLVKGSTLKFDIQSIAIDETRNEYYGSLYRSWGDAPIIRFSSTFVPLDTIAGVTQSNAPIFDSAKGKLYFAEVSTEKKPSVVTYDPALSKVISTIETSLPVQSMSFITKMIEKK